MNNFADIGFTLLETPEKIHINDVPYQILAIRPNPLNWSDRSTYYRYNDPYPNHFKVIVSKIDTHYIITVPVLSERRWSWSDSTITPMTVQCFREYDELVRKTINQLQCEPDDFNSLLWV